MPPCLNSSPPGLGKENKSSPKRNSVSGKQDKRQPARSFSWLQGSRSRPSTVAHVSDRHATQQGRNTSGPADSCLSRKPAPKPNTPILESPIVERPLRPAPRGGPSRSGLAIPSAPQSDVQCRQIVYLLASVPAVIRLHGQIAFGDDNYVPFQGHRFDQRRVALRPGLHPQPSPGAETGWTEVRRGRRARPGPVSNHTSADIAVLDRCTPVEQSGNPFYGTGCRPALVVAVGDSTVTLALITSFRGKGLETADRFTKLVSYPVSGTAVPHECFDYGLEGGTVSITNQALSLGPNWKYFKGSQEVEQFILVGSLCVVPKDTVQPDKEGYEVDEESFTKILAEAERQTSPALARELKLGSVSNAIRTL